MRPLTRTRVNGRQTVSSPVVQCAELVQSAGTDMPQKLQRRLTALCRSPIPSQVRGQHLWRRSLPLAIRTRSRIHESSLLGVMSAGLRAATAAGPTWKRCRPVELGGIVVGFGAHCSSAFGAKVVVLVSAGENEQKLRPNRRRAAASGAEQAGRLKLAEALAPGHLLKFYTGNQTTRTLTALRSNTERLQTPRVEALFTAPSITPGSTPWPPRSS